MMGLSFAAPWILLALGALPVLWWLLKVTPPVPRRVRFPAIRLLLGLQPREETPHRTPPWLIALRLLIASLVILALAHPLINAGARLSGQGPLLLVVDDGWAAAPQWEARRTAMTDLIDEAERAQKPVMLLTTAPRADGQPIAATSLLPAAEARSQAQALAPKPWPVDRAAALAALGDLQFETAPNIVWLSDGIATAAEDASFALAEHLQRMGSLRVLQDPAATLPLLQLPPTADRTALTLRLRRAAGAGERTVAILASGEDGHLISREEVVFRDGATEAERAVTLPLEMRNRIVRLAIEGEDSSGSVVLLDERWRQRPVGVVSGGPDAEAQPLLGDLYYIERALTPHSETRKGNILELLQRELAVLVLADVGNLPDSDRAEVAEWIEQGGVLLRFAGPRLAQNADALLPVRLRGGDRTLGGALSWSQPAQLAPFPTDSPFAGLAIPKDLVIRRQVLAQPEVDLGRKTWARLQDGTPLVTAERRGDGWLILVHTTANTDWSNLSLSGLFVEMLQRIVDLSQGAVTAASSEPLPPFETLDGFGRLGAPPATAVPATPAVLDSGRVDPRHPPGFYGQDMARRALNLSAGISEIRPIGRLPAGVSPSPFAESQEVDLKPWLLAAGLLLLLVDLGIALALRGLLPTGRTARLGTAHLGAIAFCLILPMTALAQNGSVERGTDAFAIAATADTRLAYVRTGSPEVDATSRAGLEGLTLVLRQRTAVETGPPLGVDIETDELAFFPLLYWPIAPEQAMLSDTAMHRLNSYLKNGGIILFDTRDQNAGGSLGVVGAGTAQLRDLVQGLDIPPLIPVPTEHVLTKAFYLMQEFPGRWAGGGLWVEDGDDSVNDGVSSVIIGGNDWAGAWAVDDTGRPMFPVVPGGERQREMAYRFGVNLVMYALTGNYKSDQVHVPAILERLGQ
ncbi:DUF4159 domain-containing protein [Rhodospirillaceae bacterium SYSU D60014]|uniref:DUF4159 domain-containing protein n=1 Tax=Virgifigura deserti TaxID=2268457 RepID=UPI000E6663ED